MTNFRCMFPARHRLTRADRHAPLLHGAWGSSWRPRYRRGRGLAVADAARHRGGARPGRRAAGVAARPSATGCPRRRAGRGACRRGRGEAADRRASSRPRPPLLSPAPDANGPGVSNQEEPGPRHFSLAVRSRRRRDLRLRCPRPPGPAAPGACRVPVRNHPPARQAFDVLGRRLRPVGLLVPGAGGIDREEGMGEAAPGADVDRDLVAPHAFEVDQAPEGEPIQRGRLLEERVGGRSAGTGGACRRSRLGRVRSWRTHYRRGRGLARRRGRPHQSPPNSSSPWPGRGVRGGSAFSAGLSSKPVRSGRAASIASRGPAVPSASVLSTVPPLPYPDDPGGPVVIGAMRPPP